MASVDVQAEDLARPLTGDIAGATLSDLGAPGRAEAVIEVVGRTLAVAFAIVVAQAGVADNLLWLWAMTAIWTFAIQVSLTRYAKELQALGIAAGIFHGTVVGLVVVLAASAVVREPTEALLRVPLAGALTFAFVLVWMTIFRRYVSTPRRIIIVGTESVGQSIGRELAATRGSSFSVLGFVSDGGTLDESVGPQLGSLNRLSDLILRLRPDIVVIALDRNRPAIFHQLLESDSADFRVVEASQFCEHAFGRVPVRDVTRAWFMSVLHLYQRPYSRFAKRTFDVVCASFVLLVTSPILVPVIGLCALSRGPVIFRQERVGEHGRSFTIFKLRTMEIDAEEPGVPQWATERDPRVTRLGSVLRRLRIDELPQLWNVLRGDMSIVGPRPERPEFMRALEESVPFWSRRQLVKPGITGWAQIRLGYTSDMEGSAGKLSYDLWYLRHRSIVVDFWICVKTVGVLITGGRSVANDADTL